MNQANTRDADLLKACERIATNLDRIAVMLAALVIASSTPNAADRRKIVDRAQGLLDREPADK